MVTAQFHNWGEPLTFGEAHGTKRAHEDRAELHQHQSIIIQGRPDLQGGPTLRVDRRRRDKPSFLRKRMADAHVRPLTTTTTAGLEKLIHRLAKVRDNGNEFMRGLQCVEPRQLTGQPWGTTAQQHFFWYRLTVGALPVRDKIGQVPKCPHAFCTDTGVASIEHTVRACSGAKRVWTILYGRWGRHSTRPAPTILAECAAGMRTPQIDPQTRQQLYAKTMDDTLLLRSTKNGWRVACAAVAQSLWLNGTTPSSTTAAPMFLNTREGRSERASDQIQALGTHLQQHDHTHREGQLLEIISDNLRRPFEDTLAAPLEVRLYFDGGSRGNPGHTGTGSVILERRKDQWTVPWWSSHYMGENETDNAAEHEAMRRGAEECGRRYRDRPAHVIVIGDSQAILRQIDGTNRVEQDHLAHVVVRTQRALRRIESYELRHTLRTGNKMADLLANVAMDLRRTTAGPHDGDSTTPELYDRAGTDTIHPTTATRPEHNLLATLTLQLAVERTKRPTPT